MLAGRLRALVLGSAMLALLAGLSPTAAHAQWQPQALPGTDNTGLYVGLGIAGALVVGGVVLFFVLRGDDEAAYKTEPAKLRPFRGWPGAGMSPLILEPFLMPSDPNHEVAPSGGGVEVGLLAW